MEEVAESGFITVNDLPEEILELIFSFLSIKERIKIERVCKHWQYIGTSFQWKVKHLKFEQNFSMFVEMTDTILTEILKRCGSSIVTLDLTGCFSLTSKALSIIGDYCPNLRSVELGGIPTTNNELKYFASKCPNLKVAILNSSTHHGFGEKGLRGLLQKCQELEVLHIRETSRIRGFCFQFMSKKIRSLIFNACTELTPESFLKLGECKLIERFELNYCLGYDNTSLEFLLKNSCKTLKHLSLSGGLCAKVRYHLLPYELLTNLEYLSFEENDFLVDETLINIAHSCKKLRSLNVSCTSVTDIGLKHLISLPLLKILNVSYLHTITDEAIKHIALSGNLESFIIRGNEDISDNACIALAAHCTKLTYLDVSSCTEITNATVDSFKNAMKMRKNDYKHLKIYAGGTGIGDFIESGEEGLTVSSENLCPNEWRPWRVQSIFDSEDSFDCYDTDDDFYDSDNSCIYYDSDDLYYPRAEFYDEVDIEWLS